MSEFIHGQPASLAGLVDYQTDSVVSKTLIKKNTGTITLFAFDQNQALSEHTAPFDALVYIVDGRVQITISGSVRTLAAGEVMVMPAHHPHALKAIEKFKMMLVMIRS